MKTGSMLSVLISHMKPVTTSSLKCLTMTAWCRFRKPVSFIRLPKRLSISKTRYRGKKKARSVRRRICLGKTALAAKASNSKWKLNVIWRLLDLIPLMPRVSIPRHLGRYSVRLQIAYSSLVSRGSQMISGSICGRTRTSSWVR